MVIRLPAPDAHPFRPAGLVALCLIAGCQLTPTGLNDDNLQRIETELQALETLASTTQAELQALNDQQAMQLDDVNRRLQAIDTGVQRVPRLIISACQSPEIVPATCDEVAVQSVVTKDDKMIVGALEHLWINPPGIHLIARVDTGSFGNSIHATDVTPFERDGEDWVRFTLELEGAEKGSTEETTPTPLIVERKIVRLLRISKRPVVRLSVRLGTVLDSFDFILSDRSDEDQPVELGRNFLQDVALVDVGKQFVQPRVDNPNKKTESGNNSPDH